MKRDRTLNTIVRISLVRWLLLPFAVILFLTLVHGIAKQRQMVEDQQSRNAAWICTYLETYLDRAEHILNFVVVNEQGQIDHNSTAVLSIGVRAQDPVFWRVMVLDGEANLVSSYPASTAMIDLSGIIGQVNLGEPIALTAPYVSIATDRMVVSVARRTSVGGYTVAAELNLDTLQRSIESGRDRPPDTVVFLTDRWGNVIAHPVMSYVEEQVNLGSLDPVRNATLNTPLTGFYRIDETLYLVTAVREQKSGWIAVVAQKAFSAFVPALAPVLVTFAALGGVSIVALGLFRRRFDRIIVRPLSRFAAEIEGFRHDGRAIGEPTQGTFSELETLFSNFWKMSESIRNRERELTVAAEEKETLLREIHHRVKNNLNVVASLLSLQSAAVDSVESARIAFEESRSRIYSIARVHESLYGGENLSAVDMHSYVTEMAADLADMYDLGRQITITTEIDRVELDIQDAVPCGIILNELVTNAFKHAFPEEQSGEIYVEFRQPSPGRRRLVVRDNGVGIEENGSEKRVASPIESLGMKLIEVLVEQISGTITRRGGDGSEFEIEWTEDIAHPHRRDGSVG